MYIEMDEIYINISIKTTKRDHKLHVKKSDCIFRINELIGNEENIPSFRVRILLNGRVLDKEKTIESLEFSSGTVLSAEFLNVVTEMNVFIKITEANTHSKYVSVAIDNTCSLYELKKRIETLEGIKPSEQSLSYCGQKLFLDSMPLFETSVPDGGILNLIVPAHSQPALNCPVNESDPVYSEGILDTVKCKHKPVEIVFSVEISDENSFAVQKIKTNITEIHKRLKKEMCFVKMAAMFHGSFNGCKNHVFSSTEFSTDINSLLGVCECFKHSETSKIEDTKYNWLLRKANSLNWSDDAHSILIVIGDCEPDETSLIQQNIDWHSELDILSQRGIRVFSGLSEDFLGSVVDDFYPELCKKTNGFLIKQDELVSETINIIRQTIQEPCERNETELQHKTEMCMNEQRQIDSLFDENNNEIIVEPNAQIKNTKLDEKSPQQMLCAEEKSKHKNISKSVRHKHRTKNECTVM